jgi:dipeptidyl aminopeptidase/acylaminoacyl peptidase
MTSFDRFENRLPALLDELATPRLPDYADDLFARTAATRQRPGWTFPERWLPMSVFTRTLAGAPRIPWRLGALVALLAVAAIVAVLVSGALVHERPAPYGPAGNGQILFVNSNGQIVAGDPATGTTTTLVSSGLGISNPIFSQDGTRFAFIQPTTHGLGLFVGDLGGGAPIEVSTNGFSNPTFLGWSGRSDRILMVDNDGVMLLFDTTRPGPPTNLSDLANVGPVDIGPSYNFNSAHAFRPPFGDEIMFVDSSSHSLMAVHADGSDRRVLLDHETSTVPYVDVNGAEWSPDGSQLVLMLDLPDSPGLWRLFILNADGTGFRRLGKNPLDNYNSPKWSPDGTKIGFQYWTSLTADDGQGFHGIGVLDLATGSLRDLGPMQNNGFTTWEWSPDGTSILELPGDGSNKMHIVDVATGQWTTTPWTSVDPINWQRIAK